MAERRRIAVLFHKNDVGRKLSSYAVYHLAASWRRMGHDVVFLFGTRTWEPADIVLVHVDLSVVPDEYLSFAARYPIALNGRVKDIRKATCSEIRLGRDDPWPGPVIVKTNLNNGGRPERALAEPLWVRRRWRLHRAWLSLAALRGTGLPGRNGGDYRIYDRMSQVPMRCYRDPRLIVEKFIPETEDGLYFVRTFHFLGDRWTCTRLGSPEPIVKVRTTVCAEPVEPAAETAIWRTSFELDYGKLDYVVVGGRAVLLDVNKTTGSSQVERPVDLAPHREHRAAGIEFYFRREHAAG
jgi:hypothetical protein